MAFRRGFRRKPKINWLPTLGQGANSANLVLVGSLGVDPAGALSTAVHALIPDYPAEALVFGGAPQSLADFQSSGYRLRRVVGKFNCASAQNQGDGQVTIYPPITMVAAGLIVLRVDDQTGAPLRAVTPIDYSPLGLENVRDPWIWRRTWCVSNSFAFGNATAAPEVEFPRTNAEYGSAWDGPHIDQKTARRVALEERLFLVVSTQNVERDPKAAVTAGLVYYNYEARYVTSPLVVSGNRRNASR